MISTNALAICLSSDDPSLAETEQMGKAEIEKLYCKSRDMDRAHSKRASSLSLEGLHKEAMQSLNNGGMCTTIAINTKTVLKKKHELVRSDKEWKDYCRKFKY